MTALLWLGGVLGALVLIVLALRVLGAFRWAELIRTHTRQLESGRVVAQGLLQSAARFHVGELEGLPAPVQRYFRAVLTDGQPIIAALTIEMAGRINLSESADAYFGGA